MRELSKEEGIERYKVIFQGAVIEKAYIEEDKDGDEWTILELSNGYVIHVSRMVIVHPQIQ